MSAKCWQVPEGAGVENWEVHHRGAVPLGAPALQHFGGGIRAQGDPTAAARLLSHVGSAPEEVRHPWCSTHASRPWRQAARRVLDPPTA
jgi:hypothetical protein